MNKFIKVVLAHILVYLPYGCTQKSDLSKKFNCAEKTFANLETVTDFENKFSILIPKNWKTNLYYDTMQTSVYFADTTKQLTETTIIDITYVKQKSSFDDAFFKNIRSNYEKINLKEQSNHAFSLKNLPSYYSIVKGNRSRFPYTICNVFINTNSTAFIHAKLEVYGDSLVNERLCRGISLLEDIHLTF